MLIPSIDLMGGKIVQLVGGEKKALETDDFDFWIARFSSYQLVQLIDLDAAMDQGDNRDLVATICARLPCQVGGGIRSSTQARAALSLGARRVIFGSALFQGGAINTGLARDCSSLLGIERLTFAIDSRAGKVAVKGWKESTGADPVEAMRQLDPYCSAFLYTHIDREGTMTGFPIEIAQRMRGETARQLIVAGGIRSMEEVTALDALGVDAVVGMALYTGKMQS